MLPPRYEHTALGWREWISLPDWEISHLKAKIDTGARTSSLHAFGLEWFDRAGNPWVRFEIHPWQHSTVDTVIAEAPVLATRDVRSSSGDVEHRPVVRTAVVLAGQTVDAEITLTRRDEMGFRMLIGREALRRRFVIDPGASYLGGRPDKAIRRRNRGTDGPAIDEPSGDHLQSSHVGAERPSRGHRPSSKIAGEQPSVDPISDRQAPA